LKKLTLFFLIFTLSFLAVSSLIVNEVKAQTTYNWIQNSGFDGSGGQVIINPSFESGWTGYTHGSNIAIVTTQYHTGTHAVELYLVTDDLFQQTGLLVNTDNITSIGFWAKATVIVGSNLQVKLTYNDSSFTQAGFTSNSLSWNFIDISSLLTANKWLTTIYIEKTVRVGNAVDYIDDLEVVMVGNGQTLITPTTTPWFTNPPVRTHYPQIVDDTSNTNPNSCYFQIGSQHYDALMQVLSNLDSDSATSFTLYALDASGSGGATLDVKLHYSDGSWSSSTPTTINGSWIQYNFTYLIVPHKIIDEVYIKPTDYSGSYVYIDTISLLSTNPVTYISFSFDLSPSSLWINSYPAGIRLMEFGSFENQAYTATCTMYNNSVPTGNGTFLVSSSLASLSGTILNGILSFNIAKRTVPVNNTIELFNIDIDSNLFNTSVTIKAYWYKLDYVNPNDPNRATEKTNQFINAFPIFLIMALFIIPATYYLGVGGFIGGFSIASIVCVWTGIAPSWFISVAVLTDLVMIFFATRQNAPKPEV
jgi:hypothetical protein